MQTLEKELKELRIKLAELKAKKASAKQIEKVKQEIIMYECAISTEDPEKLLRLTKMDILNREARIRSLEEENEDDRKYVNILRKRIKLKKEALKKLSEAKLPKQCSIEEYLNNQ